jgi:excisionase family DNA binding protein
MGDSVRMTTDEVAQLLGVKRSSVYMAVYRGRLRRARHTRGGADFDLNDVERYLLTGEHSGLVASYWATVPDVAVILGVTPGWVYKLAARQHLPAVRDHTGRIHFRRHQVEIIANAQISNRLRRAT